MTAVNWKHIAHDVVVVGGIVESALSVAGTLGPNLPAGDVALVSTAAALVALIVSLAEDLAAGVDPTSSIGKLISGVVGVFQHPTRSTPNPAAPPNPIVPSPTPVAVTPTPAPTPSPSPVVAAVPPVDPAPVDPAHPFPPVGG